MVGAVGIETIPGNRIAPCITVRATAGGLNRAWEKFTWQQSRFRFNLQEGVHGAKWTSKASSSFALEGCRGARLAKGWVLALERRFEPLTGVPKMFLNDARLPFEGYVVMWT